MIGKKITDLPEIQSLGINDAVLVETPEGSKQIKGSKLVEDVSAMGPKGDTGAKGDQGLKGDKGGIGPIGPTGLKGDTGAKGGIGPKGDKGNVGPIGNTGVQGPKGDTGLKGDIGPAGINGVKGDTGADGDSAQRRDINALKSTTSIDSEKLIDTNEDIAYLLDENMNLAEQPFIKGDSIKIDNSKIGRTKGVTVKGKTLYKRTHTRFTEDYNVKVTDCSEGETKGLTVKGKTLQNIANNKNPLLLQATAISAGRYNLKWGENINHSKVATKKNDLIKLGSKYTVVIDIYKNDTDTYLGYSAIESLFKSPGNSIRDFGNKLGRSIKVIETVDVMPSKVTFEIYFGIWKDGGDLSKSIEFSYMIFEGDWSAKTDQLPSSYVEDIKSLGEDENKISILSQGKNLLNIFDSEKIGTNGILTSVSNKITFQSKSSPEKESISVSDFKVNLIGGKTYTVSYKSDTLFGSNQGIKTQELYFARDKNFKDDNFFQVCTVNNTKTVTIAMDKGGDYYIRFDSNKGDETVTFWDLQVEEGTVSTPYAQYQTDKKDILLPSGFTYGFKSLPNGICDEVLSNGDCLQKVNKKVFTGNEVIRRNTTYGDVTRFDIDINNIKAGNTISLISNIFPIGIISTPDLECINIHAVSRMLQVQIKTAKADTIEVFRTFITGKELIYELAESVLHKAVTPFNNNLKTFKDITHISTTNKIQGLVSGYIPIPTVYTNTFDTNFIQKIESMGDKEENTLTISSTNKNLFDCKKGIILNAYLSDTGSVITEHDNFYQEDYIPLTTGEYTISSSVPTILRVCVYDHDKNFILRHVAVSSTKITFETTSNCLIRISGYAKELNLVQLQEGRLANSYVVHKNDIKEIPLPVENGCKSLPNGVCDEVFDNGDYLQRICKYTITGNEAFKEQSSNDTNKKMWAYTNLFSEHAFPIVDAYSNSMQINSKLTVDNPYTFPDKTCMVLYPQTNGTIRVNKLLNETIEGLRNRIAGAEIYYELAEPILHKNPLNAFSLNTYEDVTHITTNNFIKGEISGTSEVKVKGLISQHTNDINDLNKKADVNRKDINNLLSVNSSFGELPFEGENIKVTNSLSGYTKGMTIKGRTLQNIVPKFSTSSSRPTSGTIVREDGSVSINRTGATDHSQVYVTGKGIWLFKPSTTYTVIANITKNTLNGTFNLVNNWQGPNGDISMRALTVLAGGTGLIAGSITTNALVESNGRFGLIVPNTVTTGELEVQSYMVLEGDLTSNPISNYFEGIKSLGEEENKLSILSTNKNLFKPSYKPVNVVHSTTLIKLDKSKIYNLSNSVKEYDHSNGAMCFIWTYDENMNVIGNGIGFWGGKLEKVSFVKLRNSNSINWYDTVMLEEGTIATTFEEYKSDKKDILLPVKDGCKSLPVGLCDEILPNGDYLQNVIKFPLTETTVPFVCNKFEGPEKMFWLCGSRKTGIDGGVMDTFVICNNLPSINALWDGNANLGVKFGIDISGTDNINIRLPIDRFDTEQKCKDFLNTCIVWCKLKDPILHKAEPSIDNNLETYLDTTHMSIVDKIGGTLKGSSKVNIPKAIADAQANINTLETENYTLKNRILTIEEENILIMEKNSIQQEEIDANMMATVELFEMVICMVSENIDLFKTKGEQAHMVEVYVSLIIKGKKKLSDVPAIIRPEVEAMLKDLGVEV